MQIRSWFDIRANMHFVDNSGTEETTGCKKICHCNVEDGKHLSNVRHNAQY